MQTSPDASVIDFTFNAAGRHATRPSGNGGNLIGGAAALALHRFRRR
jgi:hypothetical protein